MQTIVAAALAAILGLAFLLLGYRLFLVMLPIWGFFAGFWLGAEIINWMLGTGFLATATSWVVGFMAGVLGAVLSYAFYLAGVALVAAAFGAALGTGLMMAFGFQPGLILTLVGVGSALLVSALTLIYNLQKVVITAMTAIGGANALLLAVFLVLGTVSLDTISTLGGSIRPMVQESIIWLIVWGILAVAGFLFQLRANRSFAYDRQQLVEGWG